MKISFDFDGVIGLHEWDPKERDYKRDPKTGEIIEIFNKKIGQKIKDLRVEGHDIIVVTTRYAIWREETEQFLEDNNLMGYIDEVHFTNGAWKANKLKKLGVEKHYDDNPQELRRLKYKGIKGVLVPDEELYNIELGNLTGSEITGGWNKY